MTEDNDRKIQNVASDYEVGFGRPPKRTQFKAGQSGNPSGRKRKPKSIQAEMQAALSRKISISEGGKQKQLPVLEVIIRTAANLALKGNLKAIELVLKLRTSPEYADTDTIDEKSLSPDDQAILGEIMRQITESEGADQPAFSGSEEVENTVNEAAAEPEEGSLPTSNTAKEDGEHDD